MIALHLQFLTGRYAATAYNNRSAAEWPPHPARIFSALVATLHEDDDPDPAEADALDALAAAGDPIILASGAHNRRTMTSFVPVNDVAVTDSAALATREGKRREALEAVLTLDDGASEKAIAKAHTRLAKAREDAVARSRIEAAAPDKLPKNNPGPGVLPWGRSKQPRTFPVALPHRDRAALIWPDTDLHPDACDALTRLAERVVCLGHSSSLVHMWADTTAPQADETVDTWRPDPDGERLIRTVMEGQRATLEEAWRRHLGNLTGRVLPARHVRYTASEHADDAASTMWTRGRWIAYQFEGAAPSASAAVAIADDVRSALFDCADKPVPPVLSGRDGDGPTTRPHLAVVPLPFVGGAHGDGMLRGFALCMPEVARDDQALLRALARWEDQTDADGRRVTLGGRRALTAVRIVDPAEALKTLGRRRWSRPSRSWATVTPIALGGACGPLNHRDHAARRDAHRTAARLIRKAVQREVCPPDGVALGLEDIDVQLVFDAPLRGAAHLRSVPPYQRPGHDRPRRLIHAIIELPFALHGPLLLGSGRHFGLGLCAPIHRRGEP